jgi:hypothetical protein
MKCTADFMLYAADQASIVKIAAGMRATLPLMLNAHVTASTRYDPRIHTP